MLGVNLDLCAALTAACTACRLLSQLPTVPVDTPVNWELLVEAERVPSAGVGGDPLLLVAPFNRYGRSAPGLGPLGLNEVDLRSYLLQDRRHYVLRRLRGLAPHVDDRWYVAIHNDASAMLWQPSKVCGSL